MMGERPMNMEKLERPNAECKIWLEKNGAIFGDGLFDLLSNVDSLGSISQAAKVLGMSYRAAWGKIKITEKRWGVPLVITQVGGEMGGGARLTVQASELLKRYLNLRQEIDKLAQKIYSECFQGWPGP